MCLKHLGLVALPVLIHQLPLPQSVDLPITLRSPKIWHLFFQYKYRLKMASVGLQEIPSVVNSSAQAPPPGPWVVLLFTT